MGLFGLLLLAACHLRVVYPELTEPHHIFAQVRRTDMFSTNSLQVNSSSTLSLHELPGTPFTPALENRQFYSDVTSHWSKFNITIDFLPSDSEGTTAPACLCKQMQVLLKCTSGLIHRSQYQEEHVNIDTSVEVCTALCSGMVAGWEVREVNGVHIYSSRAEYDCPSWGFSVSSRSVARDQVTIQTIRYRTGLTGLMEFDMGARSVSCDPTLNTCGEQAGVLIPLPAKTVGACQDSEWTSLTCELWSSKAANRNSRLSCPGVGRELRIADHKPVGRCAGELVVETLERDLVRVKTRADLPKLKRQKTLATAGSERLAFGLHHTTEELLHLIDSVVGHESMYLSSHATDHNVCPLVREYSTGTHAAYPMQGFSMVSKVAPVQSIHMRPEIIMGTIVVFLPSEPGVRRFLDPQTGLIMHAPCGPHTNQLGVQLSSSTALLVSNGSFSEIPILHLEAAVELAHDFGMSLGLHGSHRSASAQDPALIPIVLPSSGIRTIYLIAFGVGGILLLLGGLGLYLLTVRCAAAGAVAGPAGPVAFARLPA